MHNPFQVARDTPVSDAVLVRRAQAGDRDALEQLIGRHQPWVYNIVVRMVHNPDEAEDVTQDVLVKVIAKLHTFKGRSRFRTWLYRIVANHVLNLTRGRHGREFTFQQYGECLQSTPDMDLPDPRTVPADAQLLIAEAGTVGVSRGRKGL